MNLEYEILVNQYGQRLVPIEAITKRFNGFNYEEKQLFFNNLLFFIMQSKPKKDDIELAIKESKLRSTFTPCVLLRKGVENHNLKKLTELPENEREKSLILLLSLFRIAYNRRFEAEKNNPGKWWYWDLSDQSVIENIKATFK